MASRILSSVLSRMFPKIEKEQSVFVRQQKITFVLCSFTVIASIIINLAGLSGPQDTLPLMFNGVFLVISLLIAVVYFRGVIPIKHAFGAMAIITQLFTCNEMLLCSLFPSDYNNMLIVGNMVILVANVMFSIIGQLKMVPYILCVISVVTYIACVVITGNSSLANFAILYIMIFLAVTLLSILLVRNMCHLDDENIVLKRSEKDILQLLNMNKSQVIAYVKLSKERRDAMDTRNLLALLGEEARSNVIANVKEAMLEMDMERSSMTEIFPELSPSEIEICRLIIMNKSLTEVCTVLGKSESNITCQRSNIRKKLSLHPSDNLKMVLQARFSEAAGN